MLIYCRLQICFLLHFVVVIGKAFIGDHHEFGENGTGVGQVPREEINLNNTYISLL